MVIGSSQRHAAVTRGIVPTLSSAMGQGGGQTPMVVPKIGVINRGDFKGTGDNALTITANYWKGHDNHGQRPMVLSGSPSYDENGKRQMDYHLSDEAPTIRATQHKSGDNQPKITDGQRIRRLTPKECERLQGFPDNWTKYGRKIDGNNYEVSDTQRYKMMGNAVTTNVIEAVAKRLPARIANPY